MYEYGIVKTFSKYFMDDFQNKFESHKSIDSEIERLTRFLVKKQDCKLYSLYCFINTFFYCFDEDRKKLFKKITKNATSMRDATISEIFYLLEDIDDFIPKNTEILKDGAYTDAFYKGIANMFMHVTENQFWVED